MENRKNMKGIVFTLEAMVVFSFFMIILFSTLLLINQPEPPIPLYETVMLNDIYQVLELNYHTDLSQFCITGIVSPELKEYLDYVERESGYSVFFSFNGVNYNLENCNKIISQNRLLVYLDISSDASSNPDVSYFHELKIGLCKKHN